MSGTGLLTTEGLLEELRARLGADRLVAQFGTGHGQVELVAERSGPRILVNGQEVPREDGAC